MFQSFKDKIGWYSGDIKDITLIEELPPYIIVLYDWGDERSSYHCSKEQWEIWDGNWVLLQTDRNMKICYCLLGDLDDRTREGEYDEFKWGNWELRDSDCPLGAYLKGLELLGVAKGLGIAHG